MVAISKARADAPVSQQNGQKLVKKSKSYRHLKTGLSLPWHKPRHFLHWRRIPSSRRLRATTATSMVVSSSNSNENNPSEDELTFRENDQQSHSDMISSASRDLGFLLAVILFHATFASNMLQLANQEQSSFSLQWTLMIAVLGAMMLGFLTKLMTCVMSFHGVLSADELQETIAFITHSFLIGGCILGLAVSWIVQYVFWACGMHSQSIAIVLLAPLLSYFLPRPQVQDENDKAIRCCQGASLALGSLVGSSTLWMNIGGQYVSQLRLGFTNPQDLVYLTVSWSAFSLLSLFLTGALLKRLIKTITACSQREGLLAFVQYTFLTGAFCGNTSALFVSNMVMNIPVTIFQVLMIILSFAIVVLQPHWKPEGEVDGGEQDSLGEALLTVVV